MDDFFRRPIDTAVKTRALDGLARVVYTGSNGDIIELRHPVAGSQADLTISVNNPPAPPAACAPFAYVTPDKAARVYYSSLP